MERDTKRLIKRMKRFFIYFAVLMLLAGLIVLGLDRYVVLSVRSRVVKPEDAGEADCILVLGCGLKDGKPGQHLSRRLDTAIALYKSGAAPKILMSGDHGREDYDEVNAMKRYAVERGVPADAILMDHAGFSTYESMVRARTVFGCESMIIVTQEFHIYRAVYDAQKQGIRAVGVCAEDCRELYSRRYNLYLDTREMLARCKDVFWCLFRVDVPTDGRTVQITGSGAQTDDAHTAAWMAEMNNATEDPQ